MGHRWFESNGMHQDPEVVVKDLVVVHFINEEQVVKLREIFEAPARVVFEWPLAGGETTQEVKEWKTPEWLQLIASTVRKETTRERNIRDAMEKAVSKSERKRLASFRNSRITS